MKTFLVNYDLMAPTKNYQLLLNELRRLNGRRVLLSTWTLPSWMSTTQLCEHLSQFIDSNDRIFVTRLTDWAYENMVLEQPHQPA